MNASERVCLGSGVRKVSHSADEHDLVSSVLANSAKTGFPARGLP